jgi:hypothetical protein
LGLAVFGELSPQVQTAAASWQFLLHYWYYVGNVEGWERNVFTLIS